MANGVDPDKTAQYEPSYKDLHWLQKCFGLQSWAEIVKN